MKNQNIVLIGFMGSGKSTTAKSLRQLLKRKIISTDQWIIKAQKKSIAKIFKEDGEEFFRQLEEKAVKAIAQSRGVIVDCGGGIVLNPRNMKQLKKNGRVIYLSTSVDYIYKRIKKNTKRPLLKVANPKKKIKELLAQRESLYKRYADDVIDTDAKTPRAVAREIVERG